MAARVNEAGRYIYHIDVNNQIQLIFPNTLDSPGGPPINRDNFLPANTELTIPRGTVNFVLHEPFGQETILMYAASEQFPDIEREMRSTGARATRQTVTVLSRGGSLVNNVENLSPAVSSTPSAVNGPSSARFTFTILASGMAEETFNYKKPVDMAGALETLRRELAGLGGSLNGNEREGFFRGPGLEGSYRVNSGDVILTLREQRSAQLSATRGVRRDYNFSFDRPRDMSGALSSVRRGITTKGGSFSGDEREGSFQASGIAGKYQVAEQVNVTIVEKPFIISHSLIEREVKNFFGVP
jgi:hypothetical protein